jgi:crossover junction endodeoxyribonuclease RuvC
MVRALLSLKEIPRPADAADALAVALCHVRFAQTEARFGVPANLLAGPGRSAVESSHSRSAGNGRNQAVSARILSLR